MLLSRSRLLAAGTAAAEAPPGAPTRSQRQRDQDTFATAAIDAADIQPVVDAAVNYNVLTTGFVRST